VDVGFLAQFWHRIEGIDRCKGHYVIMENKLVAYIYITFPVMFGNKSATRVDEPLKDLKMESILIIPQGTRVALE